MAQPAPVYPFFTAALIHPEGCVYAAGCAGVMLGVRQPPPVPGQVRAQGRVAALARETMPL